MKKFLAIMLGVILCLGVVMMTGCGVFDGNYKSIDKTGMDIFINDMVSKGPSKKVDFTKGYKIDADCKSDGAGVGFIKLKTSAKQDETLNASGNINYEYNIKGYTSEQRKGDIYQQGEFLYEKIRYNSEDEHKWKIYDSMINYIGKCLGSFEFLITEPYLPDLYNLLKDENVNVKYYTEITEKNIKVKIVLPQGTNYPTGSQALKGRAKIEGEVYYLLDRNYNVLGIKQNIKVEVDKDTYKYRKVEANITIEPNTEKVNLPNDLDKYQIRLMNE